jgi:hypothetical protein
MGLMMVVSHEAVAKRWQLPKQLQVGKSHSNKPAFQWFHRFSHAPMTSAIVFTIQFHKARTALIASDVDFSERE